MEENKFGDYRIVKRANSWIEGKEKNKLTTLDKKLLLFGISEANVDADGKCYARFSFQKFFGTSRLAGAHYRDIRKAHERLLGTNIIMEEDMNSKKTHKHLKGINVFEKVNISIRLKDAHSEEIEQDNANTVEMIFTDSIKNYILYLKDNFTSYLYQTIQHFGSEFSISLYELLKRGLGVYPHRDFDVNSFRVKMGIENIKRYESYGTMKRDVIMKAIKEINEKSLDMLIDFEEIQKSGRRVLKIRFYMTYKDDFDKNLEKDFAKYDNQLKLSFENGSHKKSKQEEAETIDYVPQEESPSPTNTEFFLEAFDRLINSGKSESDALSIMQTMYPNQPFNLAKQNGAPKKTTVKDTPDKNLAEIKRILGGKLFRYKADDVSRILQYIKSTKSVDGFHTMLDRIITDEKISSKKAYLSKVLKEEYGIVLK